MGDTPVAISDDALKLLVAEHGVRGTARLLGMDDRQTDAFRQRVTRGKWLHDPGVIALRERSGQITRPVGAAVAKPIVAAVSPTAALAMELQAIGQQTRLHLAKGMGKAAEHVATLAGDAVLAQSQEIKAVAQTADLVHGWKDSSPQVKIRLDVLPSGANDPVIDVTAEDVTPSDAWASDDVNDY